MTELDFPELLKHTQALDNKNNKNLCHHKKSYLFNETMKQEISVLNHSQNFHK